MSLLDLALRALPPQTVQHRAFVSRAENGVGDTVTTYAAPVSIQGSIQPVDSRLYQELGLNLARNYSILWTSANVRSTARDIDGDLVLFNGLTWLCESDRDWHGAQGFRKILCVEVPPHA